MTEVLRLDVYLHGVPAAVITQAPGGLTLDYLREYVDVFPDLPLSYSLPMTARRHAGDRVRNYLDNLLPDDPAVTLEWARKYGAESTEPFGLLWHVGADCAGAATFFPHGTDPAAAGDLEPLDEAQVAQRIREIRSTPSAWVADENPGRFSLGGRQSKFALARTSTGWAQPTGVHPSTHIFKTGVDRLESSDVVELLTMRVARRFGMPVANVTLERFEDQHALVVERFDRAVTPDGAVVRLHAEDVCQMLGMSSLRKYESDMGPGVSGVLGALDLLPSRGAAHASKIPFAAALAFNWVMGATDAHAKNYSTFVGPEGELTPLYDLTSFVPYAAPFADGARERMAQAKLPMRMDGNELFGEVDAMNWRSLERDIGLERGAVMSTVVAMAASAPALWADELASIDEDLHTPILTSSTDAIKAWCEQVLQIMGS